jgi:hypothetical protein
MGLIDMPVRLVTDAPCIQIRRPERLAAGFLLEVAHQPPPRCCAVLDPRLLQLNRVSTGRPGHGALCIGCAFMDHGFVRIDHLHRSARSSGGGLGDLAGGEHGVDLHAADRRRRLIGKGACARRPASLFPSDRRRIQGSNRR